MRLTLVFVLALILGAPNMGVSAQEYDDTIYLDVGESVTLQAEINGGGVKSSYEILVRHSAGGDMGGLDLFARARRLSGPDCESVLAVNSEPYKTTYPEPPRLNDGTDFPAGGWSDWVGGTVPTGEGYDGVSVYVSVFGMSSCLEAPATYEVEIRLEGLVAPSPTPTPTPLTPTPAATTLTPTQVIVSPQPATWTPVAPSQAPPASATPQSLTYIWADAYELSPGECTVLHWSAQNASDVRWDGQSVGLDGEAQVCPAETTSYLFEVYAPDGQLSPRWIDIVVRVPTSTPALPPSPIPTPTPDPTPEVNCDPTGQEAVILIVTDSTHLARSTGDGGSWDAVHAALEAYYQSGSRDCRGLPVFLDMAERLPQGSYGAPEVRQTIRDELRRLGIWPAPGGPPLGALAIVGGPDVIPMPDLPDPTGMQSRIDTDDYYSDLDWDASTAADTVITRLPDGHSTGLMLNYIRALASGSEPPEGGVIFASLQTSAHRLNFQPEPVDAVRPDPESVLNLDDLLRAKAGEVTYLIAPIWSVWRYNPSAVDPRLIRLDDFVNSMGIQAEDTSVGSMLDRQEVLFHYLIPGDVGSAEWYAQGPAADSPLITAYTAAKAQSISAGAQVFALLPRSADLSVGDRQVYNTIPLAMLDRGVHHYIGLTGSLFYAWKNPRPYGGVENAFVDIDITQLSGAFAAYYYRYRPTDPAAAFLAAKNDYAREQGLSQPWDYKTYHSFIYYGLPESGPNPGAYQNVNHASLPEPVPDRLQPLRNCPSGDQQDCDGDGLADQTEHWLVETYKPYLIFHPGERERGAFAQDARRPAFDVYWQVSPAELDGVEGAFVTLVVTYPEDYGVDEIDVNSFLDRAKLGLPCVLGFGVSCLTWLALVEYLTEGSNVGQNLVGHPGDTEALRLFVARSGPGELDWSLTHIDWKRHEEGFADEGDPIPVEEEIANGLEFYDESHPKLYVSEYKHAMYPTTAACEDYPFPLEWKLKWITINPEDCASSDAGWLVYGLLDTPSDHNVGEIDGEVVGLGGRARTTHPLLNELPGYPGEFAWNGISFSDFGSDQFFCGGLPARGDTLFDEPCAGSMAKMWFDPANNTYEQR